EQSLYGRMAGEGLGRGEDPLEGLIQLDAPQRSRLRAQLALQAGQTIARRLDRAPDTLDGRVERSGEGDEHRRVVAPCLGRRREVKERVDVLACPLDGRLEIGPEGAGPQVGGELAE